MSTWKLISIVQLTDIVKYFIDRNLIKKGKIYSLKTFHRKFFFDPNITEIFLRNSSLKVRYDLDQHLIHKPSRFSHTVGNKAKGRISKRVFQENKARQIFPKNEHFLPPDTATTPAILPDDLTPAKLCLIFITRSWFSKQSTFLRYQSN